MLTDRLEIRLPVEADRARFVELFTDDDYMVFTGGTLDAAGADRRFDGMLERAAEIPFAKQPVIERTSGSIIGYVGVEWIAHLDRQWLEFGWRLDGTARGKGYATEASRAVLDLVAGSGYEGEILALIDPLNRPSANVARKLGFTWWKRDVVGGFLDDVYVLAFGTPDDADA